MEPVISLETVTPNGISLGYMFAPYDAEDKVIDEDCLEAVRENGRNLKYIKNQTPEICIEALKECPYVFSYVRNQTPEICELAVKLAVHNFDYVRNPTFDLFCLAMKDVEVDREELEDFFYNSYIMCPDTYLRAQVLNHIREDDEFTTFGLRSLTLSEAKKILKLPIRCDTLVKAIRIYVGIGGKIENIPWGDINRWMYCMCEGIEY